MSITDIMDEHDVKELVGVLADLSRGFYKGGYIDGSVVDQMAELVKAQNNVSDSISSVAMALHSVAEAIEGLGSAD